MVHGTTIGFVGLLYTTLLLILYVDILEGIAEGAIMYRSSKNEGYHRDLVTEVIIPLSPAGQLPTYGCDILLVEHLPSGVYIDVHQIEQMVEFGGPEVIVNDPIDIEQPEYLSLPNKILVYGQITVKGQRLSTSITLPIHLRYHRAESEGGYVQVIQKHPEVFVRCDAYDHFSTQDSQGFPCSAKYPEQRCPWYKIDYSTDSKEITFHLPIGDSDLTNLVCIITIGTTLFGCLYIIYKSVFSCHTKYIPDDEDKAKKQ
ncbi:phosphatidylinositol-glycan biosynthesis class X protein-like [Lineus longissimus]|uniref:phosphatidylinositol-glycan biosynthesis class X protein-like n=1 Tax=Lineus longissimus TaxID=88925 RepID=UPI002B4DD397